MVEKLTLDQFRKLKEQLIKTLEEAEQKYESINIQRTEVNNPMTPEELQELEINLVTPIIAVQNELLSYDLSDIDFSEWEDLNFFGTKKEPLDFSKTRANIDFSLINIESVDSMVIFKNCNLINISPSFLYDKNSFDNNIIESNPDLFLSDQFDEDFANKFYNHKIMFNDIENLSDAQIKEFEQKFRYNIFADKFGRYTELIRKIGLRNVIAIHKQEPKIDEFINSNHYELWQYVFDGIDTMEPPEVAQVVIKRIMNYIETTNNLIYNFSPNQFSPQLQEQYPYLFVENTNLSDELKSKFYNRELTLIDIVNNVEVFKDVDFVKGMKSGGSEKQLTAFLGSEKILEFIDVYGEVFKNLISNDNIYEFARAVDSVVSNKNNLSNYSGGALFERVITEYLCNRYDGDINRFPEWARELNITIKEKLTAIEELEVPFVLVKDKNQRNFINRYGVQTLLKLDKETGIFSYQNKDDNGEYDSLCYFNVLANLDFFNRFKVYSSTDLSEEFGKLIVNVRSTNDSNIKIPPYDFLKKGFKEKYPQLFLMDSAPEELKNKFYSNVDRLNPSDIQRHPEWIEFLNGKELACGFKSEYSKLFTLFTNQQLLECSKKYGSELDKTLYLELSGIANTIENIILSETDVESKNLFFSNQKLMLLLCQHSNSLSEVFNGCNLRFMNLSIEAFNFNSSNLNIGQAKEMLKELVDKGITSEQMILFSDRRMTNYKNIEMCINEHKKNQMNTNFDEFVKQFKDILSKRDKSELDYESILFYLRTLKGRLNKTEEVDQLINYATEMLKNQLNNRLLNSSSAEAILIKIINGEKSIRNFKYLISNKTLAYSLNIDDLHNVETVQFANGMSLEALTKTNNRHVKEIISLLEQYNLGGEKVVKYAHSMYQTVGFNVAQDIIKGKYGPITLDKLDHLFGLVDLSEVLFKVDGKKYSPILNEEYIRLIYGDSYKIEDTPIKKYLSGNMDRTIQEFFQKVPRVFNEWDIIEEEFFKARQTSKLSIKKNVAQINKILNFIASKKYMPDLEPTDYKLMETDIFQYVGIDTQYTTNPERAPARAIELSRMQEKIFAKKFPNINLQLDDISLSVYHPQDRNIMTAGYKSACCFRPNGNADNQGKNNSLLTYCVATEYGGGIEIKDYTGKLLMFSPLLRNGNVLIVHSIETMGMTYDELKKVNQLLQQWSKKVVEESTKVEGENGIKAVVVTNLHDSRLDKTCTVGNLPESIKVYNLDNQFTDMYNNLDTTQFLLAIKDGVYFEDIKTGPVSHSYEYPKNNNFEVVVMNQLDLEVTVKIDGLKRTVITLANERKELLEDGKEEQAVDLLRKIKENKTNCLIEYKKLLERNKNTKKDPYMEYKKGLLVISRIDTQLGKQTVSCAFRQIKYGDDWYVAITDTNELIYSSVNEQSEQFKKVLGDTLRLIKPTVDSSEMVAVESVGMRR